MGPCFSCPGPLSAAQGQRQLHRPTVLRRDGQLQQPFGQRCRQRLGRHQLLPVLRGHLTVRRAEQLHQIAAADINPGDVLRPADILGEQQRVPAAELTRRHPPGSVGLAHPGGQVLYAHPAVIGHPVPLGQPLVAVRAGEQHNEQAHREHAEQQQGHQALQMIATPLHAHCSPSPWDTGST